jgi:hypothetical protein
MIGVLLDVLVVSTYYWPVNIMKIIITTSASFFRIRRRNEKKKKNMTTTTIVPFQVPHLIVE